MSNWIENDAWMLLYDDWFRVVFIQQSSGRKRNILEKSEKSKRYNKKKMFTIELRISLVCVHECTWAFNKFSDFFVQAYKIVEHSWKFSMLLLYILWDAWLIFMIPGSNKLAEIWIHPTKAWLSQQVNFKNAIWTWGRTIYNKIVF